LDEQARHPSLYPLQGECLDTLSKDDEGGYSDRLPRDGKPIGAHIDTQYRKGCTRSYSTFPSFANLTSTSRACSDDFGAL
jgi:hypothetical protein